MSSGCGRDLVRCERDYASRIARGELLDDVPKRSRVISDSDIASHDRDNLWRLAQQFCRCQMHGIECTDRFDGKRAADASEHCSINVEDETAPLEGPQGSNGGLFFHWRQPSSCPRPDDRSARLCEGQGRCHVLCSGRWRHGC